MSKGIYEARIKLPKGGYQDVRVQADSVFKAKQLIEMQYGKGSIQSNVVKGPLKT